MEKKLKYKNEHGDRLVGILTKGESDTCVVLCHGFMSDKDENTLFSSLAESFAAEEIGSFRFDFTGCGESEERPLSVSRMRDDLEASLNFIERIGFDTVVLLGHSLGCVPVIQHSLKAEKILLSPYYKPDNRRVDLLQEEIGDSHSIQMKNRFGVEHTLNQDFLDEMRSVNLTSTLKKESQRITVYLAENDDIMPEDYYEEINNLKDKMNDIVLLNTNHFYTTNRKKLYKSILLLVQDFK